MTTIAISYKAAQQKIRAINAPHIPWKAYYVVMLAVLLCMLVAYVYLVNQLTGGSYVIKNYNREITELTAANKELQTTFAESGFLGNVQERVKSMNFEKTTEVTYVEILKNTVGVVK